MKFFIIAILAAFCFSGFGSAAKGYLESCHHFDVHGLDGKSGREVRMYAECKNINDDYVKTNLDLNTCFEWANCGLSYPGRYDPLLALQAQSTSAFEKCKYAMSMD